MYILPACYVLNYPEIKDTQNKNNYVCEHQVRDKEIQEEIAQEGSYLKEEMRNTDARMTGLLNELRHFIFHLVIH
jgi:FtsZ-binding cell division protein ZapB